MRGMLVTAAAAARSAGTWTGEVQLTPTATRSGASLRDGDRIGDRLAGSSGPTVPALVGQPGRRVTLLDEADEDLRLADRRDRLEGEHVGARLEQGVDSWCVDLAQHGRAGVVVAAILGPVCEHRGVRTHRSGDEPDAVALDALRLGAVARGLGQPDAAADRRQRRRPVEPGVREAGHGRLVAGGGRDPGAGAVVGEMDVLDGLRLGHQQARGPEAVAQVVAARLELGREAAIEDDRARAGRPEHGSGAVRAVRRGGRSRRSPASRTCRGPCCRRRRRRGRRRTRG